MKILLALGALTGAAQAQSRTFYDASGKVTGRSSTSSSGAVTNYDASGRIVSREITSGNHRRRYEILDRDAHTCRYFGRSPPDVKLHVDHVISQASWRARFGSFTDPQTIDGVDYEDVNDRTNLITSCSDCNLGKSARTGSPPRHKG